MSEYVISKIYPADAQGNDQVNRLLEAEGIRRDANLDYTCGVYDGDTIVATGSCFRNTLRCLAVSSSHQGEGLMNKVVSHLVAEQYARGNVHLFLYTKCESAGFFADLGFHEIARVEGEAVFMENRRDGFSTYLDGLERETAEQGFTACAGTISAVVMNANPFTLGHQYLLEQACKTSDLVHLFVVSEDASLVPFQVRKQLIQKGCTHLSLICIHDSGPYVISNATFPSYFQRDEEAVIRSHALIDLQIFCRIAHRLGITRRFVGEEPTSVVTGLYNRIMAEQLPAHGIEQRVVPRIQADEGNGRAPISASTARQAIRDGDWERLRTLVPQSTYDFFRSPEAEPVIQRIRAARDVIHY